MGEVPTPPIPEWTRLAPHRPLGPGDPARLPRPDPAGERVADLVRAGKTTVLVAGPVGVGKSTEVAAAAAALQSVRIACIVPLDRFEDMRKIEPDQAALRLAGRLVWLCIEKLGMAISEDLREGLYLSGVLPEAHRGDAGGVLTATPQTLLVAAIEEVARLSQQGRVAFLVDGLEKSPPEVARDVFDVLSLLPDHVDVVAVVPWSAVYGPASQEVVRPGESLVALRPLDVEGVRAARARAWLVGLLARRLGLAVESPSAIDPVQFPPGSTAIVPPDDFVPDVVQRAAFGSGGIPRSFLQLLSDASAYAAISGRPWPCEDDLDGALRDHADSFRRLLLPGDVEACEAADGTDGRALELDRKLRLLGHGMLLERVDEAGLVALRPHPLLRPLLHG